MIYFQLHEAGWHTLWPFVGTFLVLANIALWLHSDHSIELSST